MVEETKNYGIPEHYHIYSINPEAANNSYLFRDLRIDLASYLFEFEGKMILGCIEELTVDGVTILEKIR